MQPIDRPFRFMLDTSVVWVLLAVTAYWLTSHIPFASWYSRTLAIIGLPLFVSLALYGPVFLSRHIVHSTIPGWFVVRVLLSIIVLAALFFGVVWLSGSKMEIEETVLVFAVLQLATVYLHWRLKNKRTYYDPLRDGNPGFVRRKAATIGDMVVVLILLVALGFFLWGYISHERLVRLATLNAPMGWKQLRVGMSTQEVVALIGYPPVRGWGTFGTNTTSETWQYSFGFAGAPAFNGPYVLTVTNGKVFSINIQ